jgi:hypothetical protein
LIGPGRAAGMKIADRATTSLSNTTKDVPVAPAFTRT